MGYNVSLSVLQMGYLKGIGKTDRISRVEKRPAAGRLFCFNQIHDKEEFTYEKRRTDWRNDRLGGRLA